MQRRGVDLPPHPVPSFPLIGGKMNFLEVKIYGKL